MGESRLHPWMSICGFSTFLMGTSAYFDCDWNRKASSSGGGMLSNKGQLSGDIKTA